MEEDELNPWAWLDEEPEEAPDELNDGWVTAVMVTRQSEKWIEAALASLARLDVPPHRLIVIDNESSDRTRELLAQAYDDGLIDAVYTGDAEWGFSQAVASALSLDAADRASRPPDWIWLLHDDIIVEPTSLARMLRRGSAADEPAVIIPKLLQGSRRGASRQISEIGVSISSTGARRSEIEQGEFDQGQYETAAVLGGSTCGMLVRADAWQKLGGLDPDVNLFRVGTEFGWRANLAGYRVVTAPEAGIMHRHVGRAGIREGLPADPTVLDRRNALMTVAAHRRGLRGFFTTVRLILTCLGAALGFLLGKAPKRAWQEWQALGTFLRAQPAVGRMRKRIFSFKATHDDILRARALRPRRFSWMARVWRAISTWFSEVWQSLFGGMTAEADLDEMIGDDFASRQTGRARRPWVLPTLIVFVTIFLLTLLAARGLYGRGELASTQLNPAQGTLGQLFTDYVAPIPGQPGVAAAPWVGLFSLLSVLTFGQPGWAILLLVAFAVPLTALAAYAFLRRVCMDRRLRLVGAVMWGALPALLGATARGDLTTITVGLVLPLLGMSVQGWQRRSPSGVERWRGPFAVALWLSVLVSIMPAFYLAALAIAVAVIIRHHRPMTIVRVLTALVVPLLLLSPWLPTLWRWPGRILTGASPTLASSQAADVYSVLLGRSPGEGLPAAWISIAVMSIVWVMAVVGVALRPRLTRGWVGLVLVAMAGALLLPRLLVTVPPENRLVHPDATPWMMIMFAAAITTACVGWDGVTGFLARRSFGVHQALSVLALGMATWAALMGVGSWVASGLGGPLHRTESTLPSFVVDAQQHGGMRTLAIDVTGGQPRWNLIEGDGTRTGDEERGGALGGSVEGITLARQVVGDMVQGVSDADLTQRLNILGVGYVVVHGADPDLHASIGSTPGFSQPMGDEGTMMWRVTTTPGGAYVDGTEPFRVETSTAEVPSGPDSRRFIIAQPQDPRWHATLNGAPLKVVVSEGDFRQQFLMDRDGNTAGQGGTLRWGIRSGVWWAILQGLGFFVVAVLASPSLRRQEIRDPAMYARFAARLEGTH